MQTNLIDECVEPGRQRHELGGISSYLPDFESWRTRLSFDARHLLMHLEMNAGELARQAGDPELPELTRQRALLVQRASQQQLEVLRQVLAPLQPEAIMAHDLYNYFNRKGRGEPELFSHFVNLHRDWGWGDSENELALEAVTSLLPSSAPKRVLVPGAGACRLAYDLHRLLKPELGVATDLNPLLMLCARKLLSGEALELHEFPQVPLDLASYAVSRELRAAHGAIDERLVLLFDDIAEPCFRPGSFDLIVTSWLIDAVPVDIRHLFPVFNRLLAPGGYWLNLGPTLFRAPLLRCYSVEEVLATVQEAGFEVESQFQRFFSHLHSPASAHQRNERLLGFRARKTAEVASLPGVERWAEQPPWLRDPSLPIELGTEVRGIALAHQVSVDVLLAASLGHTLTQITGHLVAKFKMPPEVARSYAERTLSALIDGAQSNPIR